MNESERIKRYSHELEFDYLLYEKFPKLELRESNVSGKGVFTTRAIKAGDAACPLVGILYNMDKARINHPKYSYQISDNIAIETENEPGFINHSCSPNVYVNDDWMLVAMRDIKEGEELVLDYRTADFSEYSFTCTCKSAGCSGVFNGKDSANIEFKNKMGKYYSPYLKRKFLQ